MIWLIGANGMLGREISEKLSLHGIDFQKTDLDVDITDFRCLEDFCNGKCFSWLINCSAYTAVDKAETEPDKAMSINAEGVANIAKIAHHVNAKLIHFSTDYVFDGSADEPYSENHLPNPVSVYGKTKYRGEELLQKEFERFFIIRISWLYGIHGPNFVKTMLRLFSEKHELNVVNDQIGSPTWCGQLAENIVQMLNLDPEDYGIYHYSDEGDISWYDFACEIKHQALKHNIPINDIKISPISTDQYPTPAKRPANSRFCKDKIKELLRFDVVSWQTNLEHFFNQSVTDSQSR
jgi:dTDP-4-dehydrorhamnose reductase